MAIYEYYVNLDERGEFNADVRNENGDTMFQIHDADELESMVDFGFMKHGKDLNGLVEYLQMICMMHKEDKLVKAN